MGTLKDVIAFGSHSFTGTKNGCDQIEGSYGSFGFSPTNPIPVNGIIGELVYIFRLRSQKGVGFLYHRLGGLSSPPSKNTIDHYELVSIDASEWYDLFFDCYYPRRSQKAPDGLKLVSWNSLDNKLKKLAKLPFHGVNIKVDNFPHGLPDAIESCKRLNDFIPEFGFVIAKGIRDTLNEHKGQWERDKTTFKDGSSNMVHELNEGNIQFAKSLEFLLLFFTNYEDIKTDFNFKNTPNNLDAIIEFVFFLDITEPPSAASRWV
jgi:hypothetical protein